MIVAFLNVSFTLRGSNYLLLLAYQSDGDGSDGIYRCELIICDVMSSARRASVIYDATTNLLSVQSSNWTWVAWASPGSSTVIETGACRLYCEETTVIKDGGTIRINWCIALRSPVAGAYNQAWMRVWDRAGNCDGWDRVGGYSRTPGFNDITTSFAVGRQNASVDISFTSVDSTITIDPVVTVNGHAAYFVSRTGTTNPACYRYTYRYHIQSPTVDPDGAATIRISGTYQGYPDASGSMAVEDVDSIHLRIDNSIPWFSVSATPTQAYPGDTVEITVTPAPSVHYTLSLLVDGLETTDPSNANYSMYGGYAQSEGPGSAPGTLRYTYRVPFHSPWGPTRVTVRGYTGSDYVDCATTVENPFQVLGNIIYVRANAPLGGNGNSWATAYRTIQQAVGAAPIGRHTEVWVAKGLYATPVEMREGVSLYGGFSGNETRLVSKYMRRIRENETILHGWYVISSTGGMPDNMPAGPHDSAVVIPWDVTRETVLDGFTICAGGGKPITTDPNAIRVGGGIYCHGSATIMHNTIKNNGVHWDLSDPVEQSQRVRPTWGAGIYVLAGGPAIVSNLICDNTADRSGASVTLEPRGGGICLHHAGDALIANNTIADNRVYTGTGPSIHMEIPTGCRLLNNIIRYNTCDGTTPAPIHVNLGGIIYPDRPDVAVDRNCYDGLLVVDHNGVPVWPRDPNDFTFPNYSYYTMADNIGTDPYFASRATPRDYHLTDPPRYVMEDGLISATATIDPNEPPVIQYGDPTGFVVPEIEAPDVNPLDPSRPGISRYNLSLYDMELLERSTWGPQPWWAPDNGDHDGYHVDLGAFEFWDSLNAPPSIGFSPNGGTFTGSQNVAINATINSLIFFTTDGTDPDQGSSCMETSGVVNVPRSLELRARAFRTGIRPSTVKSAAYTIR